MCYANGLMLHLPDSALVVLDRDGVINFDSDDYIKNADEWIPIPGSLEAIARLKEAGYLVAVATNQSAIGRGYISGQGLEAIHQKFRQELSRHTEMDVDLIVHCPHLPSDNCECRKPRPGLLQQIQNTLGAKLEGQFLVGDSLRDLQAAISMNMQPLLVKTGNGQKTLNSGDLPKGVAVKDDLSAAVNWIIEQGMAG
jgi:D-glycero-D-manno-heptose 1,7-bisphosphate phosphatase